MAFNETLPLVILPNLNSVFQSASIFLSGLTWNNKSGFSPQVTAACELRQENNIEYLKVRLLLNSDNEQYVVDFKNAKTNRFRNVAILLDILGRDEPLRQKIANAAMAATHTIRVGYLPGKKEVKFTLSATLHLSLETAVPFKELENIFSIEK